MISNSPYKGTKDFYPKDQLIQNFIFEKWKQVCLRHGFEEYQTPIIEPSEIYEAKSGEDVGNKELFTFKDLAERKLCLRPEMTPSVTRIVSAKYKELPKPIKFFSIGSFYRNERPQKGRNREFWQINADIFGDSSTYSDLEILSLCTDIMKEFNAPTNSYEIHLNNRKLINGFLNDLNLTDVQKLGVLRIMDKFEKLTPTIFEESLLKFTDSENAKKIHKFLTLNTTELETVFPKLKENEGFKELASLISLLKEIGLEKNIKFSPSLVRGFDYYDGLVFEVFDTNPDNPRSLFGGGRYNGLAAIFGSNNFPAVGFAVGNETFRIFLENWNLIPEHKKLIKIPQIGIFAVKVQGDEGITNILIKEVFKLSAEIRHLCSKVILDTVLEPKSPSSGLDYISNKDYDFAILIGPEEYENKNLTLKDMSTGKQTSLSTHKLIEFLNQLPYENN